MSYLVLNAGGLVLPLEVAGADPPASTWRDLMVPRNYPHIRLWGTPYAATDALEASGTHVNATQQEWWANHFDLTVTRRPDLWDLKDYNPDHIVTLYVNYNNLTQNYTGNIGAGAREWEHFKIWTDTNVPDDADYEAMWVHFVADVLTSSGASYETYFDRAWSVTSGGTFTSYTYNMSVTGDSFSALSGVNSAIYVGDSEGRFREVNVDLVTGVVDTTVVWEYWNGSTWATLTLTSDTTSGMTTDGKITFFPPVDWARTKVSTDLWKHFYVRARVSAVGSTPSGATIDTVRNEDFYPISGSNTLHPGWDPDNDYDGDGYVSDADIAALGGAYNSLATARFKHWARSSYANMFAYLHYRWHLNLQNPQVAAWNAAYIPYELAYYTTKIDGIMEDNGFVQPFSSSIGDLAETPNASSWASWIDGTNDVLTAIRAAIPDSVWFQINTSSNDGAAALNYCVIAGVMETESYIIPTLSQENFTAMLAAQISRAKTSNVPTLIEARMTLQGLTRTPHRLFSLSMYYLMHYDLPNAPTYFYYGGEGWRGIGWDDPGEAGWPNASYSWFDAMAYDIGQPTADAYVFATPTDPTLGIASKVWGRVFTNALVLCRPKARYDSTVGASPVTVSLGGSYQPLLEDGTLGTAVTTIDLNNSNGAILIPV